MNYRLNGELKKKKVKCNWRVGDKWTQCATDYYIQVELLCNVWSPIILNHRFLDECGNNDNTTEVSLHVELLTQDTSTRSMVWYGGTQCWVHTCNARYSHRWTLMSCERMRRTKPFAVQRAMYANCNWKFLGYDMTIFNGGRVCVFGAYVIDYLSTNMSLLFFLLPLLLASFWFCTTLFIDCVKFCNRTNMDFAFATRAIIS